MKRGLLTLTLALLACGDKPPPSTPSPNPSASSSPNPAASSATSASPSSGSPAGAKIALVTGAPCVLRGQGALQREIPLRYRGKRFAVLREVETIEVQVPAQGTPTASGRSKALEFTGEVQLGDLHVGPTAKQLVDGWYAVRSLRVREVNGGELAGPSQLPRALAAIPQVDGKHRCDAVTLGDAAWSHAAPTRVVKPGASASLRDGPGGKVVAKLDAPPASSNVTILATQLETKGKEIKLAISDDDSMIEVWTDPGVLYPAGSRDEKAALLAAQAESLQLAMLGSFNGAPATIKERVCAAPISIYVREGNNRVEVAQLRASAPIRRVAGDDFSDDVAIDLGVPRGKDTLVPVVATADWDKCTERTVTANGGLVVGPSGPPIGGHGAPEPQGDETKVHGPRGDAQVGNVTATPALANAQRVVAGLRARFRACYQQGLNTDPTMSGSVSIQLKVAPNGDVTAANVLSNKGLSVGVTACMARGARNAQFDASPSGSEITIPINLTQK
jgi:hypothetical protein